MDCNTITNPILPEAGVLRSVASANTSPLSGQYDGAPLNSCAQERGVPENRARQGATTNRRILRCKHPLLLSTLNVRTLRVSGTKNNGNAVEFKTDELCHKLKHIGERSLASRKLD